MKAHGLPDNTFTFWVTAISLLYSSDGQLIISAFARRISTLVDNTSYLHLSGIICFPQNKKKKSKVRLRVFMHLYGQTTNPLWSRFEKRTIRSVHLSIWFTLDKRKIKREKRDIVMQKNWWREGLGRAGQGGTENFGAYSSWALTFTPDLSLKGKLWVNTCSTSCSLLQTIQLEEKEKQSFLFSTGKTGTFRAQGEENRCFTPCNY